MARIYGIQSSTINEWIKKYDRKDLMNTRIMVETKDEISRLKALQKEVECKIKKVTDKEKIHLSLAYKTPNRVFKNVV